MTSKLLFKYILGIILFFSISNAQKVAIVSQDYKAFHSAAEGFKTNFKTDNKYAQFQHFIINKDEHKLRLHIKEFDPDAILSIGENSTLFSVENFIDVPIVFSMVKYSRFLNKKEVQNHRAGICGVTTQTNKSEAINNLKKLFESDISIVVAYSKISEAEALDLAHYSKLNNIPIESVYIEQTNQIQKALKHVKQNTIFWILPDPTIYSARVLRIAIKTIKKQEGMIIAPTEKFLKQKISADIAFTISPEKNGKQAALLLNNKLNDPDYSKIETSNELYILVKNGVKIKNSGGVKWVN